MQIQNPSDKQPGVNRWVPSPKRVRGSWDSHGNNFDCLKDNLLPEFDRGFSALIEDLAQRNLLDQTAVMITSEMGRKPKIGDPRSGGTKGAGRDHWTHCLTDVLAGGGIQGGQTFGSSDRLAAYPADKPVTPADVTKTVYHAMSIHDLIAYDNQNRPYQLLEEGRVLRELFEVARLREEVHHGFAFSVLGRWARAPCRLKGGIGPTPVVRFGASVIDSVIACVSSSA